MKRKLKIVFRTDGEMRDTPAAVDRETGVMYINPRLYNRLTPFEQKFVRLHEEGHYKLNTSDEIAADGYAFDRLAGTEFRSLKQCVQCLNTILDDTKAGHRVRKEALYERAIDWDRKHGTTPTLDKATKNDVRMQYANANLVETFGTMFIASNNSTASNLQTKDNTLIIAIIAIAALYLFSQILK